MMRAIGSKLKSSEKYEDSVTNNESRYRRKKKEEKEAWDNRKIGTTRVTNVIDLK